MITLDQCVGGLRALADGPDFLGNADNEVRAYLVGFRGYPNEIAQARVDLIRALQDGPDFVLKGRILDRIAGLKTGGE